jgi:phage-related minor tail protein
VKSSLAQAPELIEQYERLRQQVLGRNLSCGSRIGQAVLVSRGVVAWMRAVSQSVGSILPACSTMSAEPTRVPDSLHEDLVRVMGEAVLALARQEAL